jgi:uncharacterized damage-inducible protein DinB
MQTIENIKHLFSYNEWANRRVIEALKASSNPSAKAIRALTHLLIAEKEWLKRLQNDEDSTRTDFWPEETLEACEALADEVTKAYREMLDGLSDDQLKRAATYKNSKGVEYTTTYEDIFTHVLMHSAYHRGQVAMATRAEGDTPAYTDYIGYVREREARPGQV